MEIPDSFFAQFIAFTSKKMDLYTRKRYTPANEAWVLRLVAFDELIGIE
jgi:hypothetical protein